MKNLFFTIVVFLSGRSVFSQSNDVSKEYFELKSIPVVSFVYPPFSFVDEQGVWQGADIEIMNEVLKRMGYKPVYQLRPFQRLLKNLKEGSSPMSVPIVEGGGREEFVFFTNPVSYLFNVLWKPTGRSLRWESYDDLKGLRIGATKGYHYGAGFQAAGEGGKFVLDMVANDHPEKMNFKKTVAGRIDTFICEINVGYYIKHQNQPRFDHIDYAETGVGPKRPFSVALSKRYYKGKEREAQKFLQRFNETLKVITKEKFPQKIFKKYNMKIEFKKSGELAIEKDWRKKAER